MLKLDFGKFHVIYKGFISEDHYAAWLFLASLCCLRLCQYSSLKKKKKTVVLSQSSDFFFIFLVNGTEN